MIRQFTYTASPWGKTGAGWMVFQQSRGVPPEAPKALYPIYNFSGIPTADGAARPVQFAYIPADSGGGAVLAQTTFTGTRWFDPRPGDFFAHVLMLDKDAVAKSASAGSNPARLFKGAGLQAEFPEPLREKALKIYRKDIAWELPPELPTFNSLADVRENPELAFEIALRSIPPKAVAKLGAVLRSLLLRASGKGADSVVFDGSKHAALALVAVALDLFPPTWRARTWFAIQFRESVLRRLSAFSSLTFYTTDVARSSEPDTGIVSGVDFSKDPFQFADRDDVLRFKKFLDKLGPDVSFDDYKELLVACWQVAAGRKVDVESLREAVMFAERFPGMKDEVASGFASALADYNYDSLPRELRIADIVAGYELGMDSIRFGIPGGLGDFVRDGILFADTLRTLEDDAARMEFANAVAKDAEASGAMAQLASMWLGCEQDVRALLSRNVPGPFAHAAALADRYDSIRRAVAAGHVEPGRATALLAEVEKAAKTLGDDFDGMAETQNGLRYLAALDGLKDVGGLQAFATAIDGLGVDEEKVRADVLERVKPGDIPSSRLAEAMDAFEVVGVSRRDVLRMAVETAEGRGREEGERSGRHIAHSAVARAEEAEAHCGIRVWLATVIAVSTLLVGLAGGWFLHALTGVGKADARSTPPGASHLPIFRIR